MSVQDQLENKILTDKRISVFTGHFGSGKTEIAINYAFLLKKMGFKVVVVDLDVVNPYFRLSFAKKQLEDEGIKIISPINSGTNAESTTLPPEVKSVFLDKSSRVIFDVGGDESGARILSVYKDELTPEDYDIFMVVNTRRTMTNTASKVTEMLDAIRSSLGLNISGLISNTHLLDGTSILDVKQGYEISLQVSKKTDIPIRAVCVPFENSHKLKEQFEDKLWYIKRYVTP